MSLSRSRGYSLIEMLLATGALAVLAVVVLRALETQRVNQKAAALVSDTRVLQSRVQQAYADEATAYRNLTVANLISRQLTPPRWTTATGLRNEFGAITVVPSDAFGAGGQENFRITLPAMPVAVCVSALPQLMEGFVRLEVARRVYFSPSDPMNMKSRGQVARAACQAGGQVVLDSA